jgi:hypothetical protein
MKQLARKLWVESETRSCHFGGRRRTDLSAWDTCWDAVSCCPQVNSRTNQTSIRGQRSVHQHNATPHVPCEFPELPCRLLLYLPFFSIRPITMEAIQTIRESLSISELLNGLGLVLTLRRLFASFPGQGSNTGGFSSSLSLRTEVITTTGLFILFLAAKCLLALVNTYVPEPYLVSIYPYFYRSCL